MIFIRLKETSTKLELQNHELIGVNRLVESMRADLAQKDKQIETYNKKYVKINASAFADLHIYLYKMMTGFKITFRHFLDI